MFKYYLSLQDPTGIGKGPEYAYPKEAVEAASGGVVDAPAPGEGQGESELDKEPEMTEREIQGVVTTAHSFRKERPCAFSLAASGDC